MMYRIDMAARVCRAKVDEWFKRVFKEQAGAAELIATLIIVGVVLVLAFAFRRTLITLVKNLWKLVTEGGNPEGQELEGINLDFGN